MCPNLQDTNFQVLILEIALDKIYLDCAEKVKAKPTRNDKVFIIYSHTINFLVSG